MIPKTIHYCWFGRNPIPKLAKKCIKSWKKYCPEYQIIEWNEDNFDIAAAPLYVRQAYEAKKWAFVTDYVRLDVVYRHGGIYLDTDVEVIRSLDSLLANHTFFGLESGKYVATGLGFGAEKSSTIISDMITDYQTIPFLLADCTFDLTPCPIRNTKAFLEKGMLQDDSVQMLEDGTMVFSSEYFCPIDYSTGRLKLTSNTYTIHHFSGSWLSAEDHKKVRAARRKRRWEEIRYVPNRALLKWLGEEKYSKLKKVFGK